MTCVCGGRYQNPVAFISAVHPNRGLCRPHPTFKGMAVSTPTGEGRYLLEGLVGDWFVNLNAPNKQQLGTGPASSHC